MIRIETDSLYLELGLICENLHKIDQQKTILETRKLEIIQFLKELDERHSTEGNINSDIRPEI